MEEIRGTDCNELIKKVLEVEELRPVDLAKKIGVSRQYANQIISRSKYNVSTSMETTTRACCKILLQYKTPRWARF